MGIGLAVDWRAWMFPSWQARNHESDGGFFLRGAGGYFFKIFICRVDLWSVLEGRDSMQESNIKISIISTESVMPVL